MPQTLFDQRRVIDPTSAVSWAMSTGLAWSQRHATLKGGGECGTLQSAAQLSAVRSQLSIIRGSTEALARPPPSRKSAPLANTGHLCDLPATTTHPETWVGPCHTCWPQPWNGGLRAAVDKSAPSTGLPLWLGPAVPWMAARCSGMSVRRRLHRPVTDRLL